MSTTHTATSTVDRIAAVVKEITGRLRVNGFDIIGINAMHRGTDNLIHVDVHAETSRETIRLAYYLGCTIGTVIGSETLTYDEVKLVGVPAMVSVFGPAPAGVTV